MERNRKRSSPSSPSPPKRSRPHVDPTTPATSSGPTNQQLRLNALHRHVIALQPGRLNGIVAGIRAVGDDAKQIEALTQLCELLSVGNELSLAGFPVEWFVSVLSRLLNYEGNADIMLLAARAITYFCDALPMACEVVVRHGGVGGLCAKLLSIQYMDLAEQSLQALKKISQEHPADCLRAGALMAVLSYLDFFSTEVQRLALSIAANMCKKLPPDTDDFVMDAVPFLANVLNYHDAQVVEHAAVCLTHISKAFSSSPDKLDALCNHGLVAQAAALISVGNSGGQTSLSPSAYMGLIRFLSTCGSGSPLASKTLLLLGISGTLKDILSGFGLVSGISVFPASTTNSPDQIYEIVNLADGLLSPLPNGTISLPTCSNVLMEGSSTKKSLGIISSNQDEPNGMSSKLLDFQLEILQQFGMDLLPVLIQVYNSSVSSTVKYKCLSIFGKIMYFSSIDMIQSFLGVTNIASVLAGILTSKDSNTLLSGLSIAEILMEKLPETFAKLFVREGVVYAIDSLLSTDSLSSCHMQVSSCEVLDPLAGVSSQRCSRVLNTENVGHDTKGSLHGDSFTPPDFAEVPSRNSRSKSSYVGAKARSFKDKYFPIDPAVPDAGLTDDLLHLRHLCSELSTFKENVKAKSKDKCTAGGAYSFDICETSEQHLDGIVREILREVTKDDGVSTFEFVSSGVILALLNYLSCGTFGKEKISDAVLPKLRLQALRRYKSFISTALPLQHGSTEAPLAMLVQKLQSALSSLECFPVVLSSPSRSSNRSSHLFTGLSIQPVKLRFCRAHGEKSLRDYSSKVMVIDPLTSLAAVEQILWPKVQLVDTEKKSSASLGNSDSGVSITTDGSPVPLSSTSNRLMSTSSRSAVAFHTPTGKATLEQNPHSSKGKGKAVSTSINDEARGRQIKKDIRRRDASDKDANKKPEHYNSSFEGEELEMYPADINDALVVEGNNASDEGDDGCEKVVRDYLLPVCAMDNIHDTKLGYPGDGTIASLGDDNLVQSSSSSNTRATFFRADAVDYRSGSTLGSRDTMSFAVAMTNFASVSGKGTRGGQDHQVILSGGYASDKLIFTLNGKKLSKHLTISQAMQRWFVPDEEDDERYNGSDQSNNGGIFSTDVFTITYQRAGGHNEGGSASSPVMSEPTPSNSGSYSRWKRISLLDSILQGELPSDFHKSDPTYNILALLRILESINQLAPRFRMLAAIDEFSEGIVVRLEGDNRSGTKVLQEDFVNNKITEKLSRQVQDALIMNSDRLPLWCNQLTKACPFLFPFEIRRQFFYSTAFALSRALQHQHASNRSSQSERMFQVSRLQRKKFIVSRNHILSSAEKIMKSDSCSNVVLEVEYRGEVGSGLGPTLEFYTLLSHELQQVGLQLWRSASISDNSSLQIDEDEAGRRDLVQAPFGLFPRPWLFNAKASDSSQFAKAIKYFHLLGWVVAKALQDGRLLDLPLSMAFYKLVLGQVLDMHDIFLFDVEFGKILKEMKALFCRKKILETNNRRKEIADLQFRGASIDDLCLDFTLPGYPNCILKEGGENIMVDIDNLEEYILLVVHTTVRSGIMGQMEAFRSGFNQVFDISSLQIFSPRELDFLIHGQGESWEPEHLLDSIKFDHGYTSDSPVIVNLLEIMREFTPEEQQAFCQFVTGAPRLPCGGLAALNPKLTIVRKHFTSVNPPSHGAGASETTDNDLPSVMTCAHYLKLPPYSTKEIMYKKLLYAIIEGQGSFDLS